MSRRVLSVAWYRFRVTFGGRRGGYLTVVLLAGLVGGVAMGAVAAARRTQGGRHGAGVLIVRGILRGRIALVAACQGW